MFKYLNLEILLSRIVSWGLYAALFTPFIFWQTFMFPMITLKIFGFHILIEAIFAAWILYLLTKRQRPVFTTVSLVVLIFLAILLITAATGVNFERSFWSTQERGIGVFSLLHFGAFFLILSDFLRRGFVKLELYLKTAVVAGFGVAAGGILEKYQPQFFLFSSFPRIGSFLGNPAYLADYLLFCIFFAFWFAVRVEKLKEKLLWLGVVAFDIVIIVFFTQTRGAILGLGAGLFFLLTALAFFPIPEALPKFSALKLKRLARILLIFAAALAAVFLVTINSPLWAGIPGINRIASLSGGVGDAAPRLIAWRIAWNSFLERPLLGWGFENFKYAMDWNFHPSLFRYGFGETYWDKPHNIFLEYLVSGGILGIAVFLALFWVAFRAVLRLPLGIFFAAALTAHLVSNIFVFDTFGSYLMFFIVLAAADFAAPGFVFPFAIYRKRENAVGNNFFRHWPRGITAWSVILATFALVALNINILYANNRHYWGANYFVNGLPEEGLNSFRKSLNAKFNPYVNAIRRDFGDLVTQMYVQKKLPEPEKNLPWAVSEVDKAIGEDPKDYYLYLTLADMTVNFYELNPGQLLSIGQAAIDKAIKLSNRQQNYYVKAKLHLIRKENEEALRAVEKAVALDPQIGDPHFYYALTLLETGNIKKGFEELEIAEELGRSPNTAEEARIVANYYGDAENWEKSIFWYKFAIAKDSSDNEARLKLGLVYYMSGKPELAKEEISKVMQKEDLTKSPAYELLLPILRELGLER